ncbi:hypothetical protein V8G54_021585 [Vigna mungo]|uniref:Uncharacterized protein n=1 Tax=Vigna mungo TaxID=3915 RepID=A0AAQ3RXH7_VIGMU
MREYVATIPFPQRLKKQEQAKQFERFLDVFKKLHINIPFVEALEQMSSYEECSAIIQQKLPPKLKDQLCHSIINLMPLSIFKWLGIGEVKPTMITLQLADRSMTYPYGIVEDVLVKMDKFIFPADFVVLDMEEDAKVPIIFGRPFLATGRNLIDVEQGELMLRVGDEKVTFSINEAVKHKLEKADCFKAEIIESLVLKDVDYHVTKNPLERALLLGMEAKELSKESNDEEVVECAHQLEVIKPLIYSTRGIKDLHKSESREEDTSKIDLKQLSSHLKYRFLDEQKLNPIMKEMVTKEHPLLTHLLVSNIPLLNSKLNNSNIIKSTYSFGILKFSIRKMWNNFCKKFSPCSALVISNLRKVSWKLEDEEKVKRNFHTKASHRLSDMYKNARTVAKKPDWLGDDTWNALLEKWNMPLYRQKCETAKKNRTSEKGSISVHEHAIPLSQELSRSVHVDEIFQQTHIRQSTGEFVDERSRRTHEQFQAKFSQIRFENACVGASACSPLDPADEERLRNCCWLEAAGGKYKGRAYDIGNVSFQDDCVDSYIQQTHASSSA